MSLINLSLPTGESPCNGKHISFSAPCSCEGVTGVKIGDTTYSLVNSVGLDYVSNGGRWVSGAYMTVMLDVTNSKAYVVTEHIDSNITSITIPSGRMRGDVDGDGKITEADADLISAYVKTPGSNPLDETQLLCADTNNDGSVSAKDTMLTRQVSSGYIKAGSCGAEITGNWTNNPNYATEDGQFYTDIPITGMTANHSASVIVKGVFESGFFTKAECVEGAVRIYAKLCPIEALSAVVSWGSGNGTAVITTESVDVSLETLGACAKPTIASITLVASSWDSTSKTYSFETDYPVATYDIEISLDSTATAEQAEAFNGAQIVGSATSNVVKAYGDVPTVDIPIIIKVVTK